MGKVLGQVVCVRVQGHHQQHLTAPSVHWPRQGGTKHCPCSPAAAPRRGSLLQEQRALLQTALGLKLLPETTRVAGEEAEGGRWGSTQGFCFAGRCAQQGTGKSTLGCPVHKLLWWLLKCLKRGSVLRQQCKLLCYARAVPLWQLQEKFMFKASPWASEQWNESHFCREWKVESRHLSG